MATSISVHDMQSQSECYNNFLSSVSDSTGWVVAGVVSVVLVGVLVGVAVLKAKGYNCKKGKFY